MPADLRRALIVSLVSTGWTTLTSTVGIALGIRTGSLALVAFGATGFVDAAGSALLAANFRNELSPAPRAEPNDRRAHVVISSGLVLVGAFAGGEAIDHLVTHRAGGGTTAGAVLAGLSAATLAVLASTKSRIAGRLGSAALRSDSHLSATGALLGLVTLGGVALRRITWLDAACTLAIGVAAVTSGILGWPSRAHEGE